MIRRYGDAAQKGRRYVLRPGVYAILPRDGMLLLTHQTAPTPEVQLPGGGVDGGEQPLAALHREVLEETGWRIASPRRLGAFRRFTFMPEYDLWAEKICTVFLARPVHNIEPPRELHHSALWVTAGAAVRALGNDGDAAFVARHIGLS
ncbi:NUDIX domain-containing protein [Oceaniglobus indicus]|uniref:NUDIX domain-containing protein n=1 Tax=Oceaniglobus indicus TaxID=2047749 RepID=UPI000C199A1C|nr:NUDIX hydrolase [Oceaniglobus indicus]